MHRIKRMDRITRIVSVLMVSMFAGLCVGLVFAPNLALAWMGIHLMLMPLVLFTSDTRWGLTILSWIIPGTQLVRTLDHDGEIHHVLAYGEWGQTMTAYRYWAMEIGAMVLYPNGYVGELCFVYCWEPVNVEACAAMHLTYDFVDLESLAQLDYSDRNEYRHKLETESKLMHVTHI